MDRRRKDTLFEAIALMGKAFASPVRLELLDLLAQAPRTVEELARASGQSTANALQRCPPTARSSRTAAGRSAPTPTRRCGSSAAPEGRPDGSRTVGRSGGCRTTREPPDRGGGDVHPQPPPAT